MDPNDIPPPGGEVKNNYRMPERASSNDQTITVALSTKGAIHGVGIAGVDNDAETEFMYKIGTINGEVTEWESDGLAIQMASSKLPLFNRLMSDMQDGKHGEGLQKLASNYEIVAIYDQNGENFQPTPR
jgi:hypothetical protein